MADGPSPLVADRVLHGRYRLVRPGVETLPYYDSAIALDPNNCQAYLQRSYIRAELGPYAGAVEDLKRAMELDVAGDHRAETLNGLAWLRATCMDQSIRDGKEAVKLARQACECSDWQDGNIIDTLAAAYAEAGQFEEAVMWQTKAVELCDPRLKGEFYARLNRYHTRRPYHK